MVSEPRSEHAGRPFFPEFPKTESVNSVIAQSKRITEKVKPNVRGDAERTFRLAAGNEPGVVITVGTKEDDKMKRHPSIPNARLEIAIDPVDDSAGARKLEYSFFQDKFKVPKRISENFTRVPQATVAQADATTESSDEVITGKPEEEIRFTLEEIARAAKDTHEPIEGNNPSVFQPELLKLDQLLYLLSRQ